MKAYGLETQQQWLQGLLRRNCAVNVQTIHGNIGTASHFDPDTVSLRYGQK